ncbi:MAG: hypothetical protein ABI151_02105 [Chitinophagaceae bacterium]
MFILAAVHLLMVAMYAGHFGSWGNPGSKAGTLIGTIGDYTGSNNIFSFFAPELSDQPYVIFATKDATGKEHVIDLKGKSPDFTNRINNIYGFLTLEEGRAIFSASLAQFVSTHYPTTEKIRLTMVVQQIPQMKEFREGKRNQWHFWFDRDFQKTVQ